MHIDAGFSDTIKNNPDIDEIINYVVETYLSDNILQEIKIKEATKKKLLRICIR